MSAQFTQYLLTGLTVGAIYALVALGFCIIFNASHVINFAQGEFVMIGGMATVSFGAMGLPQVLAIPLAVAAAALVGLALEKFAVEPARGASVITLIIITIGASIFLRGLATVVWDKNLHPLKPFSGEAPIAFAGATILPQSLWVLGITLAIVLALSWFFGRTLSDSLGGVPMGLVSVNWGGTPIQHWSSPEVKKIAFILGIFPAVSETFIINQVADLTLQGILVWIYTFNNGSIENVSERYHQYKMVEKTVSLAMPNNYAKRLFLAVPKFVHLLFRKPIALLQMMNVTNFGRQYMTFVAREQLKREYIFSLLFLLQYYFYT